MNSYGTVIVGAGQAGLQIADTLRREQYPHPITLIGDEPYPPYQRPPLSKKYLTGEFDEARLPFRPPSYYEKFDITTRFGVAVERIDREQRCVVLGTGEAIPYASLALATGSRVRKVPVAGGDLPNLCYLRGLDDAQRIKERLRCARSLLIIGGGFIGLEIAAIARGMAIEKVILLEAQARLMPRVIAPVVSQFYDCLHRAQGVDIRCDAQADSLEVRGDGFRVNLPDDAPLDVDMVCVGIGVVPNQELASSAGLDCDDGIVVDEYAQSSDTAIVAAGDCTRHRNVFLNAPWRLESVQNAVDQGKIAAATIMGERRPYDAVPWFWSDQYDVKLQMAGISAGYDNVIVRGDTNRRTFSVFYFRADRLMSVDSINRPAEHMVARRVLAKQIEITPQQAGNEDFELKTLLQTKT